ncbi:MAG: hypothetical protein ACFCBW_10980 [Candidatus Competibacterales bacterium]
MTAAAALRPLELRDRPTVPQVFGANVPSDFAPGEKAGLAAPPHPCGRGGLWLRHRAQEEVSFGSRGHRSGFDMGGLPLAFDALAMAALPADQASPCPVEPA